MSAKWMGYFFDETDLKGSELLLALAIADHADADGFCFPKMERLADKIRLKLRQTQVLLKKLAAKNHVQIIEGKGRGNPTRFQLKKVHSSTPFRDEEKVHSHSIKGAFSQQEKVHSGDIPIYKDEPSVEPSINTPEKTVRVQVGNKNGFVQTSEDENKLINQILDGIKERQNLHILNRETEWTDKAVWTLENGFTPKQFLDCYDHLKFQDWRKGRVSAQTVADNMPEFINPKQSNQKLVRESKIPKFKTTEEYLEWKSQKQQKQTEAV